MRTIHPSVKFRYIPVRIMGRCFGKKSKKSGQDYLWIYRIYPDLLHTSGSMMDISGSMTDISGSISYIRIYDGYLGSMTDISRSITYIRIYDGYNIIFGSMTDISESMTDISRLIAYIQIYDGYIQTYHIYPHL